MPHSALLVKANGMIDTLLRLTKDSLKPKTTIDYSFTVPGGYDPRKVYPPTNLKAARIAHQKHIESLK